MGCVIFGVKRMSIDRVPPLRRKTDTDESYRAHVFACELEHLAANHRTGHLSEFELITELVQLAKFLLGKGS